MNNTVKFSVCIVLFMICGVVNFALGYSAGRSSHQNVNDLLSAGYTVIDPEGYEIEKFDEN